MIIIIGLIMMAGLAQANNVQFSGLGQVNKTVQVYDINQIAPDNDGKVGTINSSDNFYYQPGDSYTFEITAPSNKTFLSDSNNFLGFYMGDETRSIALLTFLCLIVFSLFVAGGGLGLIFILKVMK